MTNTTEFTSWAILPILLIVLAGVALVVAAVRRGRIAALVIVSSLLLMGIVLIWSARIQVQQGLTSSDRFASSAQGSLSRVRDQETHQSAVPQDPVPHSAPVSEKNDDPLSVASSLTAVPAGPIPSKIERMVGNSPAQFVSDLPDWRTNPSLPKAVDSGVSKYVLMSRQFASVNEAEADLLESMMSDVRDRLVSRWPETSGWTPSWGQILSSGLITEKVIETIPLKVGEFENSVYRVSWLVEFRPEVNEALHADWLPLGAERRSHTLLAALAGITGLLGATSIVLRRQKTASTAPAQAA